MSPQPKRGGRPRRRARKNIPYGVAHIKTSFNNTIVTITDLAGNASIPASIAISVLGSGEG